MLAKEAGCVASEKCAMKKKIASFQSGNATCWQRELEAESKGKSMMAKNTLHIFGQLMEGSSYSVVTYYLFSEKKMLPPKISLFVIRPPPKGSSVCTSKTPPMRRRF